MVIPLSTRSARQHGALMADLMVAIALLVGALFPLAYSLGSEKILARTHYERAVALEIVDGEMEALVAGGWRAFSPGRQEYFVRANAATNLASGKFQVTISTNSIRLEWQPDAGHHGGPVVREAKLP